MSERRLVVRAREGGGRTHDGDHVRDAVARVDDGARQGAVLDAFTRPRRGECEHSLHGNVQALNVERLEHDLSRRLAVLGRVQGRLGLSGPSLGQRLTRDVEAKRMEGCARGGSGGPLARRGGT